MKNVPDKDNMDQKMLHKIHAWVSRNWQLYLILLLPLAWLLIFRYLPIVGILIAFKDFSVRKGILGSNWVGLKYFIMFFKSGNFWQIFTNTLSLSFYTIIAGFPIPIIFALALNEINNQKIKKSLQTISLMPYFISIVVLIGIFSQLFHLHFGIVNNILKAIGMQPTNILNESSAFRHLYVWSGIWQSFGFNAVLYIATLTTIDPQLREAAIIDGATRFQITRYINIPGIMFAIVITLILTLGHVMNVGFDKAFLMQNMVNLDKSEIISTYVYKIGIKEGQYSLSTAIGVFNSVVNGILIVIFNSVSKRFGEASLW